MNPKLIIQLHAHSRRSFDSKISIDEYVKYLNDNILEDEYAVLGIADHNIVPIKSGDALKLSTQKVLVIPGIQWRLHKTLGQSLTKLCTRRELVTIGPHDDLDLFIKSRTNYEISQKREILGHIHEEELLNYISQNDRIILIVPHPRHFFFDYYGQKEIAELKNKIETRKISTPFFIEEKTGYDPFPRIFCSYKNKYLTLGSSDAHEIYSFPGTNSLFSVKTTIRCETALIDLWRSAVCEQDINDYKAVVIQIFNLLEKRNKELLIKKNYLRSALQFCRSVPLWFARRFSDFPKNFWQ